MTGPISLPQIETDTQKNQYDESIFFCQTYFKNPNRIILNVGGVKHEVLWKTLEKYPQSRLGKIRFANSLAEIKDLCDDLNENEMFFDRSFNSFEIILNFYRTERPRVYDDKLMPLMLTFTDDLYYWGFEEFLDDDECISHTGNEELDVNINLSNVISGEVEEETFLNTKDNLNRRSLIHNSFRYMSWFRIEHANFSALSSRVRRF
jgi:hypothetical protein